MPLIELDSELWTGSATVAGATIGDWVQQVVNGSAWYKRDGSGFLVAESPGVVPCTISTPMPYVGMGDDPEVYEAYVVWETDTFDGQSFYRVMGRFLPGAAYLGGGAVSGYFVQVKAGTIRVGKDNVVDPGGDNYDFFTPVDGNTYRIQLTITQTGGSASLVGRYADATAPDTWLGTTPAYIDTTAALNDSGAQYSWGTTAGPAANIPVGWKIDSLWLFQFVADMTGPVLGTLTVPESGRSGRIPITDDYSQPILPATGITGLSFQADHGAGWVDFPAAGPITISRDTSYPARLEFTFADTLPATSDIRYSYASGNITDSNSPGNAAAAVTNSAGLNYSTYDPDTTSDKGEMFLGTQGFASTIIDPFDTNVQAQTLHPQELPYGASAGFTVDYLGYSDNTLKTIHIERAAIWVQQRPSEPRTKHRLTFNGGSLTCDIAAGVIQESDPVDIDILPGARVWTAQWYTDSNAATGLPYQTWIYTRELDGVGAEDQGGTLTAALGAWTDYTMAGGFSHAQSGPMTTGSYICRGYRSLAIKGLPHPSFDGTETVICWIGDSINVLYDDFAPDLATPDNARGFNGRFCYNRFPSIIFGQAGSGSAGFRALEGTTVFQYIFGVDGVGRHATDVHDEYGINGAIRTNPEVVGGAAVSEWSNRTLDCALVVKNLCNYVMSTITTFADTDVTGGSAVVAKAQRHLFNQRVRNEWHTITGCKGYTDPCSRLEYDFLNGTNRYWDNTAGRLHPDSTGHFRYKESINAAVFLDNPNPILGLAALTITAEIVGGTVVLTWDADPNASAYKVLRSATANGAPTLLSVVSAPTVTYTDVEPINGAGYYAVVPVE